jgi:hypothetical protein
MADIDWLPPAKLREHYVDPVAVDAQDAQRVLYLAVITGQVRSRRKGHILRLNQIGPMRDINPFSLPPDIELSVEDRAAEMGRSLNAASRMPR